jgi:hypothetical protein
VPITLALDATVEIERLRTALQKESAYLSCSGRHLAAHTKNPSEIEPQNCLKMAGLQPSKIVIQKQLISYRSPAPTIRCSRAVKVAAGSPSAPSMQW